MPKRHLPPCPVCGGASFVPGFLTAASAGKSYFVRDGRGVGDFFAERGKSEISARMCEECGRLDFFVEDPHLGGGD